LKAIAVTEMETNVQAKADAKLASVAEHYQTTADKAVRKAEKEADNFGG